MTRAAIAGVLLVVAASAGAEVKVQLHGDTVELTTTAAPLSEVLDRLARQTGMKVMYEGTAPRVPVTVSLRGRTPAETVLALLEGLGVNFALVADETGAKVRTLVIAGTAAASGPGGGAKALPARGSRAFVPPQGTPFPEPDPVIEENEDVPEQPVFNLPAGETPAVSVAPDGSVPPGQDQVPMVPPPGAGLMPGDQPVQPTAPVMNPLPFSASPFTPQPRPIPQLPPGVPGGRPPETAPTPQAKTN